MNPAGLYAVDVPILTNPGTIVEACASNVETFAAGGVIFQVSCWDLTLKIGDNALTADLDRLYCHCVAAAGLDWRHHIASIASALFLYPSNTIYSNIPKRFHLEPANHNRSTHGSVEMSHRLSWVQPLGTGVLECLQSYIQVSHLKNAHVLIMLMGNQSVRSPCSCRCSLYTEERRIMEPLTPTKVRYGCLGLASWPRCCFGSWIL